MPMRTHAHEHGALRRRSITGAPSSGGPMMTPMVDVVLVILIFFMGSATIAGHEWFLGASIERDGPAPDQSRPSLTIPTPVIATRVVLLDGRSMVLGLGPDPVALDDARRTIETMDLGDPTALIVTLGADDDVPMGDVVALHDAWHARDVRVRIE